MKPVHHKIFQRLSDWNQGLHVNIEVGSSGIHLEQSTKYVLSQVDHMTLNEMLPNIQDFAVAANGNIYAIDNDGMVWTYFPSAGIIEPFISNLSSECSGFAKLTIIDDTLMMIDATAKIPLLAYSLRNGQRIWQHNRWMGSTFTPYAITTNEELLYCLILSNQEWLIAEMDRNGKLIQVFRNHLLPDIDDLGDFDQFTMCISEKVIYIFERSTKQMYSFSMIDPDHQHSNVVEQLTDSVTCFCADHQGILYFGVGEVILHVDNDVTETVPGFNGIAQQMKFDPQQRIVVLDAEKGRFVILNVNKRTKLNPYTNQLNGIWLTESIDSLEDDTEWHKYMLQANIEDETQVRISYFCSNTKRFWMNDQYTDFDDYITSTVIDPVQKLKFLSKYFVNTIETAYDALFFKAKGRFMWLKVELIGTDRATPMIQNVKVVFPRETLVQYLPSIYHQESANRDFLDRFLSIFGTFFGEFEHKVDQFPQMYDVQSLQGEYVQWIASWLGIASEFNWSDEVTKKLIKHAPELYRLRGTKATIDKWFELITGKKPVIVEYMQYREMSQQAELKNLLELLYGMDPYTFCVLVRPEEIESDTMKLSLQYILDQEKPAFTSAKLIIIEPSIYLDSHTFLDMNTYLSAPTLLRLDNKSAMPYSTVLSDEERKNRMDIHTRLDLDGKLE